eukprot:840946-Amphidinium_carterae.2
MAAGAKPASIWRKEVYSSGVNTPLLPQGRICQLLGLKFNWDADEPPWLYCKGERTSRMDSVDGDTLF